MPAEWLPACAHEQRSATEPLANRGDLPAANEFVEHTACVEEFAFSEGQFIQPVYIDAVVAVRKRRAVGILHIERVELLARSGVMNAAKRFEVLRIGVVEVERKAVPEALVEGDEARIVAAVTAMRMEAPGIDLTVEYRRFALRDEGGINAVDPQIVNSLIDKRRRKTGCQRNGGSGAKTVFKPGLWCDSCGLGPGAQLRRDQIIGLREALL